MNTVKSFFHKHFKILIPVNRCNHFIAGCTENPLGEYIRLAVEQLETMLPS